MFDKLKLKHKGSDVSYCDPIAPPGTHPLKRDIFRNRQNYGVNIGLCFVQERWICGLLFGDGCETELQMANNLIKQHGAHGARERLEGFWQLFMNDDDWRWLKEQGVTAVRIPIGYWEVAEGQFAKGTHFAPALPAYVNAWLIFKLHFVEPALKHDIGVLVDMHGLPGGANSLDHSGETCDQGAKFWDDADAQLSMVKAFQWIVTDLNKFDNIAGIQLCNEAEYCELLKKQGTFYGAAINAIREADATIPIIISDSWNPRLWTNWVQDKQLGLNTIGVVVDDHVYRCFSGEDHNSLPQEIIARLNHTVLTPLNDNGKGVDFMIGEYSCVLDGQLWLKGDAQGHRDELVKQYGRTQVEIFSQRAKWGFFFWTYKFESGSGGEWDFRAMTEAGAIYNPFNIAGKSLPDENTFNQALDENFKSHCAYWDKQAPKEKFDHDLYAKGFTVAWYDALEFAKFHGSVLGRVQAWKLLRLQEHIHNHEQAKFEWIYAQGYEKGLETFYHLVRN